MKKLYLLLLLFCCLLLETSCRPRAIETPGESKDSISHPLLNYNFYVENSGSVKGYFCGNNNDAGIILKEFYDRIDERKREGDTITLNYINNQIKPQNVEFETWLGQIYSNCNEKYSDIDKVLEQALSNTSDSSVNFVLSDYCFESQFGSLEKAKSEITKVFTQGLNKYQDLSIAIYKYEVSFDGIYYPGGIRHKGKRPLYLWIFGPSWAIKEVSNLPITQKEEAKLFLQPTVDCVAKVETNRARMTNKERNAIIVSEWKSDRHGNGTYSVDVCVELSRIIMSSEEIVNVNNYVATPDGYNVEGIKDKKDGTFLFTFSTTHPSPCDLQVYYSTELPDWVNKSNFGQNTLPKDSTTYGIKYLIEGASNAYRNKSNKIFTFKLNLK